MNMITAEPVKTDKLDKVSSTPKYTAQDLMANYVNNQINQIKEGEQNV